MSPMQTPLDRSEAERLVHTYSDLILRLSYTYPVSYTHLDVYKRQPYWYWRLLSTLTGRPSFTKKRKNSRSVSVSCKVPAKAMDMVFW